MSATTRPAIVEREHAFEGVQRIHGVTHDGTHAWFVHGTEGELLRVDPASGAVVHRLRVTGAETGLSFDGSHLWVVAFDRICRVEPRSGAIDRSVPAPADASGLAWHDGRLWVGDFRGRRLRELDAATGRALRTLASDAVVTGVSHADGALWHGALDGNGADARAELRRVDEETGEVQEVVVLPPGHAISGLESTAARFYCGDFRDGRLRLVRRERTR